MQPLAAGKDLNFQRLFEKFIQHSQNGKRLQPNGKRISAGTIKNYRATLNLLTRFCKEKNFDLRIRPVKQNRAREVEAEKNYWKKFYKKFSNFLYDDLGHFDNYVGMCFKNIKVFFAHIQKEGGMVAGDFHKQFYVRKEDIAIHPLLPEELNFFIYDEAFEKGLSQRLKQAKDFFVFGCTVALRVSDLFALTPSNLRIVNDNHYLSVRSVKTATDSLVKLPSHAVAIVKRYQKQKRKLLPHFNKANLGKYIKILLEKAGMTQAVMKTRQRRGQTVVIHNTRSKASKSFRLCDVATTHMMRRTGITTMLCLGMNEQLVRKIAGYSPASKEFYRYVAWAQTYQDRESDNVFEQLRHKRLA